MTSGHESDRTTEKIMEATYQALCEHGYPATSISKIADEFEKSKSLLYYHYEDKEELLTDFLRYLLDQLEAELAPAEGKNPTERLVAILDRLCPREVNDEGMHFRRALLEIRSQAPYREAYQEQFERSDDLILGEITDAIEDGIDGGVFRAVDAQQTAEFIYSTVHGTIELGVTLEDTTIFDRNRAMIDEYIDSHLRSSS
jgi:AcrR family transcriptional regulator